MWLAWVAAAALVVLLFDGATGLLDVCGRGAKSIDSTPILSVQVRNSTDDPLDEAFRQTICTNTSASTVTISYSTQIGVSLTAAFDFRKELRLWRVTVLGEQDLPAPAVSVFCFVDRFSPEEVLSASSISTLRQKKNIGKIKDPDESLNVVERKLDVRVKPQLLSRYFGGGIEKFCGDTDGVFIGSDDFAFASVAPLDLTGDDDDAQWLEPLRSNLSALRQCGSVTPPREGGVRAATEPPPPPSFTQRHRCSCILPVCIPWLPCGWKLCKSDSGAGLPSSTYKCGVKSCRQCARFHFDAADQRACPITAF